jgi:hypothetical protein
MQNDDVYDFLASDTAMVLFNVVVPLLLAAYAAVRMGKNSRIVAGYTFGQLAVSTAISLIPIYGQLTMLGWRTRLAARNDDEWPTSTSTSVGDAALAWTAVWGPVLLAAAALVAFAGTLDHDERLRVTKLGGAGMLVAWVVSPLLYALRARGVVVPAFNPPALLRLVVRHPRQAARLLLRSFVADVVIVLGNMWWLFGGCLASTVAVVSQGDAMRAFRVAVEAREARPPNLQGLTASGSAFVVPSSIRVDVDTKP